MSHACTHAVSSTIGFVTSRIRRTRLQDVVFTQAQREGSITGSPGQGS